MARAELFTYKDLTDHAIDYLGANPSGEAGRDARRASLAALRSLATASRWSYYFQRYRLNLAAPYLTGTVVYDHAGGAYERVLTLTGGTWPSWAGQGTVQIANVVYEVADRKSATEVTLSVNSNPGEDVASSPYLIYRDTYPLPVDFLAMGALTLPNHAVCLSVEHPNAWLQRQRIYRGVATPRTYTIRSDPNYQNTLALSFYPPPDAAYAVDGIYTRMPRQLQVEEYSAGSATTAAASAVVAGTGTAWAARHVGCVFRVTGSRTKLPTGRAGDNAPAYERVVVSVDSATQITLDDTVDEAFSAAKYTLSDPVDVETSAMLTALLRGVESQLAKSRRMGDRQEAEAEYLKALLLAREADSRSFEDSRVGGSLPYPARLADMPLGADA